MQRLNPSPLISSPSIANMKRELFIKVFKQELIRELHYLWDVANNRTKPRDNFTKKLITILQKGVASVPVIGSGLGYFLTSIDFATDYFRDQATSITARIIDEIDLPRLEILADIVARETLWRYESFIIDSLCDSPEAGVIPFAKVGVARILEKVIRSNSGEAKEKQITMSESNFLSGLIEGRSGSFIEGWTNHTLKLKRQKKGLFKIANAEVEAEDVFARPAFRYFNYSNGTLHDELYIRRKSRHHEASSLTKLKQIYHGETDSLFDFGYTKFRKSQLHEPVAGYIIMPLSVIKNRYDYELQNKQVFSQNYLDNLKNSTISRIQIDLNTFKSYLNWNEKDTPFNIIDFVREKLGIPGIKIVSCHGDFSELILTKKDLSYMDLSGSILSGDLTETLFNHSYLIGTRFNQVTSAYKSQFSHAYAPMLTAPGVNFNSADFTHANLSYAILNECDLSECKNYGTIWAYCQLRGIRSNSTFLQEQKLQIDNIHKELEQQRLEIKKLNEEMLEQYTDLRKLRVEYQEILEAQKEAKPDLESLKKIQHLIQREEAHTTFEYYCKNEINNLNKVLEQAVTREEIDKLQRNLHATIILLDKQSLEREQYNSSELLSKLDNLKNNNKGTESIIFDFQKRMMASLKKNHSHLDSRVSTLRNELQKTQQTLTSRLEQVEDRVENLEEWAKETKINLIKLNSDQGNNQQTHQHILGLEQKLNLLIQEQQKQEDVSEKIILLQARLNQAVDKKSILLLETQLQKQQNDIEKLINSPLINLIRNNLSTLHNELSELKDTDEIIKNKDQKLLENLLLNFNTQVKTEQEKIRHLIQPALVIKGEDVIRETKIFENNVCKLYAGTFQKKPVIIKVNQENYEESDKACLLREIHITSRLHHSNIIRFYGAYLEDERPFLVMEKIENGSLYQYLEENLLSPTLQKQIILDIAQGLKYLHSQGILHRHLQSKNVLLTHDVHAKLTGFGLSKIKTSSLQSAQITPSTQADHLRWCAPEFIKDFHDYRRPADIYSFGMIMWEIVTGKKPFIDRDEREILNRLEIGITEEIPESTPTFYHELITQCWKNDPLERPALQTIIEKVEQYQCEDKSEFISIEESESLFQHASKQEKLQNHVEAYKGYLISSKNGHTRARTNLATFFLSGKGGAPENKTKAYECFLKSAEEGHSRAMINLGQMLEYGDGIKKDIPEAISWYQKAANKGDKEALNKIEHAKNKIKQVKSFH